MGQHFLAGPRLAQQQHRAGRLRGAPRLAFDLHRRRAGADKTGKGVARLALPGHRRPAALHGQLAPRVVQVALQQRELVHQRLQVGFRMVEQHNAQRADHRPGAITQGNAADDKGAGTVGQQVDQDRLAGFQHLVHLRVLHHPRDRVADKVFLALEAQRGQVTPVLVIDPDHTGLAVHQQHALAGRGKQVEHRPRSQLQNAGGITRQRRLDAARPGFGGRHGADVTQAAAARAWAQGLVAPCLLYFL